MAVSGSTVDLAVIGAGMAGLTAAEAAASSGLRVLVIERLGAGGQVMNVERITNLPGQPLGMSGIELGPVLQEQAEAAGVEFLLDEVQRLECGAAGQPHVLHCAGERVTARSVIVAAGSARKAMDVPGEADLQGNGVSQCASCDGPLYRGRSVCVVGGGDSALGEALELAAHAATVTVVFPGDAPHAQCHLVRDAMALPHVLLQGGTRVVEVLREEPGAGGKRGRPGVAGVLLSLHGAPPYRLAVDGVFVYAGLAAASGFLHGQLALDAHGRILVDARLESSVPGVFVAGDIRAGADYLLSAAAADGKLAALSAGAHVRGIA